MAFIDYLLSVLISFSFLGGSMRLLSATLPFPADALILKMIINVIVVCTYNRLKQKGHRFPANYAAVVQWFRVRPPATPGLVGSFHDDIWQRVSTWNRQSEWEETRNGNDDCYSAVNISSTSAPCAEFFPERNPNYSLFLLLKWKQSDRWMIFHGIGREEADIRFKQIPVGCDRKSLDSGGVSGMLSAFFTSSLRCRHLGSMNCTLSKSNV